MTKQTNPIVESQNSRIWGMTIDEYSWPDNSFWDSRNIDIRRNSREITLNEYGKYDYYDASWVPIAHYWASTLQWTFCTNWYVNWTTGNCWWTIAGLLGNIKNVVDYWTKSWKPMVLVLTDTAIHYLEYDSASISTMTVTYNQRTFNNTCSNRPRLKFKSWLLIWDKNKVVKLSVTTASTWVYTPASWTLNSAAIVLDLNTLDETILRIFELWDQVVVFTNKWQYFWDWFNLAYDRFVPRDETILSVAQIKTTFYVITKKNWLITMRKTSNGYDRVAVIKDDTATAPLNRFNMAFNYDNSMITVNWIVYFWWYDKWDVYSYGSYNPWMPETLQRHRLTDWTEDVTSLYDGWDGRIYVGNYTWTTYKVGYLTTSNYQSFSNKSWLMIQKPILWAGRGQDKEMVKYRIWYKTDTNGRILLYSKVDDETDRYTFYCASYTTLPTAWATYTHNWDTYTVIWTKYDAAAHLWIEMQNNTASPTWPTYIAWTLTKSTWTWDATLSFTNWVNFRLVELIDWSATGITTKYKYPWIYTIPFNKLQFALGMIWYWSGLTSPKINDFTWEYNQITNDL